jgi:hypothetical protein
MENGTPRTAPRAYYPDYLHHPPPTARTPGWDAGPERRIGDPYTLRRVLGWSSIGVAAVGLALTADRARPSRLFAAVGLLAGAAGLDLLFTRQRSWARDYGVGNEQP